MAHLVSSAEGPSSLKPEIVCSLTGLTQAIVTHPSWGRKLTQLGGLYRQECSLMDQPRGVISLDLDTRLVYALLSNAPIVSTLTVSIWRTTPQPQACLLPWPLTDPKPLR